MLIELRVACYRWRGNSAKNVLPQLYTPIFTRFIYVNSPYFATLFEHFSLFLSCRLKQRKVIFFKYAFSKKYLRSHARFIHTIALLGAMVRIGFADKALKSDLSDRVRRGGRISAGR
jgi:hypothetical protein